MVIWLWKKGAKDSIKFDENRNGEVVYATLDDVIRAALRFFFSPHFSPQYFF